MLVIGLISICLTAQSQKKLPRALILTGNGNIPEVKENYPPWTHEFHNKKVIDILKGIVEVDTTENLNELNPENLKRYDLIISNSLFLTPNYEQLKSLYDFVTSGKSFLSLHCGMLSFLNWDRYEEFMGGIFIGGPSTEPAKFKVYTANDEFWGFPYSFRVAREHPVSKAVDDFDIQDELYYFQPGTANIEVIARAENHPVMWWHPLQAGKVMSLTLGHSLDAKNTAGYQELLRNGVRWLTGYPLIFLPEFPPISTRRLEYKNFIDTATISDQPLAGDPALSVFSKNVLLKIEHRAVSGELDLKLNGGTGKESFTLSVQNKQQKITRKEVSLTIVKDGSGNIASYFGNSITATTSENQSAMFKASNMIDGDLFSRWSSNKCEQAFVDLDLQYQYTIQKIRILWEASYARKYNVLTSTDGLRWILVYSEKNSDGGEEMITLPTNTKARFIKLELKEKPPGKRGFSIYEIEVFDH